MFASFDRFTGESDNLFFSEYIAFVTVLLQASEGEVSAIPSSMTKLFYKLAHQGGMRIDRYELVVILGLLCCDIHIGNNVQALWELILITSSKPLEIDSFHLFTKGVFTLLDVLFPEILDCSGQDMHLLINHVSLTLYQSCCRSHPSMDGLLSRSNQQPVLSIPQDVFMDWAPHSFCLDTFIRSSTAVYNDRLLLIQEILGLRLATMNEVVDAIVHSVGEEKMGVDSTISSNEFEQVINEMIGNSNFIVMK